MEKNDSNYTVELRRISNQFNVDQFVIMPRGGEAYLPADDMIMEDLRQEFGIDREMAEVLLYLARAGAAVRYYPIERRVSAQFPLERSNA